ncbi:MAG: response regulator [Bacteriovoracaceae bacterium]|jgi:CheY-like chemotaxis protein|nr:response regulator [Bacteriovoracaceae bacterium]
MKILIVDDSKVNLIMISKMLESLGNKVLIANNGHDAFEVINNNPLIDLILLDLDMPVMDGLEFLKKNSVESIFDIPVIMMIPEKKLKNNNSGPINSSIDYISKPFTPLSLENKMKELFNCCA